MRGAKTPSPPLPPRGYRLRGDADGHSISVTLQTGSNPVGSSRDSVIIIPVAGVSRHHATIELDLKGEVRITDANSKNGTWLNGARIREAQIHPGDWVQFGPVALLVEEIDPRDTVVAIHGRGNDEDARSSPQAQGETEGWRQRQSGGAHEWLDILTRQLPAWLDCTTATLAPCLADLVLELGASAAVFLEASKGGEPVVLAAWGQPPDPTAIPALAQTLRLVGKPNNDRIRATSGVQADPGLAWATEYSVKGGTYILIITGDFPRRATAEPILSLFLNVLVRQVRARREGSRSAPAAKQSALQFPAGHVRGRSSVMVRLDEQILQLAGSDIPVLIVGETGVGKEHVARTLFSSSNRQRGPFVAVNCAAIPAELLEAELFGIEAGVATGVHQRIGKLETAHGGVVFLDEVGDMSLSLQAKLLRALQEREVHPLGARAPRAIDVRLLAATNANLKERITAGTFRRDLYYRIAGVTLRVPTLRERQEDIPLLVEHFLAHHSEEAGKSIAGITVKALAALQTAPWQGNVRELEHEVRRLVHVCPAGAVIDSSMLHDDVLIPTDQLQYIADADDLDMASRIEELERRLIRLALTRNRNNHTKAAAALGISRPGLLMKMRRLGIKDE